MKIKLSKSKWESIGKTAGWIKQAEETNTPLITEHIFNNESNAKEAVNELNQIGGQRNKGSVVAFRQGTKVWIRPEFVSKYLCSILKDLTQAF